MTRKNIGFLNTLSPGGKRRGPIWVSSGPVTPRPQWPLPIDKYWPLFCLDIELQITSASDPDDWSTFRTLHQTANAANGVHIASAEYPGIPDHNYYIQALDSNEAILGDVYFYTPGGTLDFYKSAGNFFLNGNLGRYVENYARTASAPPTLYNRYQDTVANWNYADYAGYNGQGIQFPTPSAGFLDMNDPICMGLINETQIPWIVSNEYTPVDPAGYRSATMRHFDRVIFTGKQQNGPSQLQGYWFRWILKDVWLLGEYTN